MTWGRRKPEEAEVAESAEALDKVRRLAREALALGKQWEKELQIHKVEGHERDQSAG